MLEVKGVEFGKKKKKVRWMDGVRERSMAFCLSAKAGTVHGTNGAKL